QNLKLENPTNHPRQSRVAAEWDPNWPGPEVIVEVSEGVTETQRGTIEINTTTGNDAGPKIIVRTEEVLIVLFVLILWVGAIALFFHRWGKIRMLEPYQPKFQQQHRSSCPLAEIDSISVHNKRASVSKMGISVQMPTFGNCSGQIPQQNLIYSRGLPMYSRPRQNSVFVGPPVFSPLQPSRKTRSAVDIHQLVLTESSAEAV
uniref:Fibronectin type III domain-containing protein n=2 Tax=Phlebotomus papatasi TaxID=29031 RepID=A0A1B0EZG3_PHLPP